MRLFVAVPITEEIRVALMSAQARMAPIAEEAGVMVKWVEPENFHLTVAFLGELSENSIADISDACAAISLETAPFRVSLTGVSVFPKPRGKMSPEIKTIWAGFSTGWEAWQELIRRAEPWFVPFGAAREGGLVPHVTLGRVKTGREGPAGDHGAFGRALQQEGQTAFGGMDVNRLVLIESILDRQGATYREIQQFTFQPPSAE